MNFRKSSKRGGGHFQSKNLYCKIWTFKQVYVTMKLIQSVARLKNLQYNFPKIHPFWKGNASLNFVFHLIEPSLRREDGKLPVNASRNICFAESSGNKQYTYNKHMLKGFSKILLTEQYCSFLRITRY